MTNETIHWRGQNIEDMTRDELIDAMKEISKLLAECIEEFRQIQALSGIYHD